MEPFILVALFLAIILHALAEAAHLDVAFLLVALKAMLFGAFMWSNGSLQLPSVLTDLQFDMVNAIPADIRTVISKLDLEPAITRYAICPKCRATHPPDDKKPHDPYPHRCNYRHVDGSLCKEPLVTRKEFEDGRVEYQPIRFFPYYSMHTWIAQVFQRPHFAALARRAWDLDAHSKGRWKDIWDAPLLRDFKGPDRKTPFSLQPEGSVHLVFSLFVDWFNPFGNKKAGKSHSVGGIYLCCLNLPPDIRYRPENIYLAGIIPGPHEPSVELDQFNHFLRPLVNELSVLWTRGIHFAILDPDQDESTLFVRAAIIPLVCDLPALRKVAGFAGHGSHHFCSFCRLDRKQIKQLDVSKWPRRTRGQHRVLAEEWKDASSEDNRSAHFKKHGVRWSELLRLPYWDPTRFALVDSMHNLFLGELRHHCRDFWGIDIKDKSSDSPKVDPHSPEDQAGWLDTVAKLIRQGTENGAEKKLSRVRKGYIAAIAELNGVPPAGGGFTKRHYIDALLAWVCQSV